MTFFIYKSDMFYIFIIVNACDVTGSIFCSKIKKKTGYIKNSIVSTASFQPCLLIF